MIDIKTVQLGQRVRVLATLRRVAEGRSGMAWGRSWKRLGRESGDAVIVGIRTLSNGLTEYPYDAGPLYTAKEHFPALLVSFDLRRRPVFALPEDVEEA